MGYDHGDSFSFDFEHQMGFNLVQNRKEKCHHDHIPLNLKGNGDTVFSVYQHLHPMLQGISSYGMSASLFVITKPQAKL